MEHIRSSATMWRATCSFPIYKHDIYHDYMRAQISEVDILKFTGLAECRTIDHINIRGNAATNISVPFWQGVTWNQLIYENIPFHTDSSKKICDFDARSSSDDEDNFGYYEANNKAFRCTGSVDSTTQYWFGVNV